MYIYLQYIKISIFQKIIISLLFHYTLSNLAITYRECISIVKNKKNLKPWKC